MKQKGEIMTTKEILEKYKTIVVYGMSTNPAKPANEVPHYMMARGYKIIPLNPTVEQIDGMKSYKSLMDIPDEIEILDVFRRSEDCLAVVEEAVERKKARGDVKVIWLQLGIVNNEAKKLAEENGIEFVQDKCIKIEYNINF